MVRMLNGMASGVDGVKKERCRWDDILVKYKV